MHMVRTLAEADGRSVRDAVERTACGKTAWHNWLHGEQPMVFQQLEQVLENYGYVLLPVPMGPESIAAKAAFLASVNRGPATVAPVAPTIQPVEDRAHSEEDTGNGCVREHGSAEKR